MIYLRLFWEFFKVGLFTVGGGLASIPLLNSMSADTGWFSREILTDMIAVSEATPGPIGVNMATYVGYNVAGIPGAVIATTAFAAPSLIIACILYGFYARYKSSRLTTDAFVAIRPTAGALIAGAMMMITLESLFDFSAFSDAASWYYCIKPINILLFAAAVTVTAVFKKLHPAVVIAGGAVIGIVFSL